MKLKMMLGKIVCIPVLATCIASGLTACGDMNASEVNMGTKGSAAENKEGKVGQEIKGQEGEEEREIKEQKEEEEQEIKEQEEEKKNEIVSYQYKNIAMSIELPPEWNYEVKTAKEMKKQDESKLCAIDFWLREKPELKFEFAYWPPHSLGLCGTGLTIEEVSFENGVSASKNTEESDGFIWLMLIYNMEQGKGNFAIDANIDKDLWEEYEDDIMKVFGMVSFTESEES